AVIEADELVAGAHTVQLLAIAAHKEKAVQVSAVRLEGDGLEAFNLALLLQTRVVLDGFAEHLERLLLAALHSRSPTDDERCVCHGVPPSPFPNVVPQPAARATLARPRCSVQPRRPDVNPKQKPPDFPYSLVMLQPPSTTRLAPVMY